MTDHAAKTAVGAQPAPCGAAARPSAAPPVPVALDVVIPVHHEAENIAALLRALRNEVRTPFRLLLCYDEETDNTVPAARAAAAGMPEGTVVGVRNRGRGPLTAVLSGFAASSAAMVLVMPADDDYNAGIIDRMVEACGEGAAIVCASRFMPGGCMRGCPWLKAVLVRIASFTLRHLARLPTHDATNGFRLFARRVIEQIPIESQVGFSYSIELLVKCHRRGWPIVEVPAAWHQRTRGRSRFRVLRWCPAYLRWYAYAFATLFARRPVAPSPTPPTQPAASASAGGASPGDTR